MTPLTILLSLKEFIQERIAGGIKLLKPVDSSTGAQEMVHPAVYIGYLPPKALLPEDSNYDAPAIIVGMDTNGGEDLLTRAELNIRVTMVTYGAGKTAEAGVFSPDMTGFMDLLNLIERARQKLGAFPVSEKSICIERSEDNPFRWGMYDEQPWPYWYGWLTFTVKLAPVEIINENL